MQIVSLQAFGLGSSSLLAMPTINPCGRCDFDGHLSDSGDMKKKDTKTESMKMRSSSSISPVASSAHAVSLHSPRADFYKEILEAARDKFTREISFQHKDKDISLAKALLYAAAEDEAFLAFNRELNLRSLHDERGKTISSPPYDAQNWDTVENMPMASKNISEWLLELDIIAKEVEADLVSRDIGCHLAEVLEAVNKVLFESRGFKRSPVVVDSKCSYLPSVLSSGCASAILVSVIYIEICKRLKLTIVGSRVGEEFLIWPPNGDHEELFKVTYGSSLFGVVNGKCVDDPRSKASDINSNSLTGLDIATNRDIIGISLANLIRLYWKRASRSNHGLMLTSPLRSVDKFNKDGCSEMPVLRSQELRLAMMASERLLILQPHNWVLRRDYGMMLYYKREYEMAVQELSICTAFAPEEEAEVLEAFVEKLHSLLRLENSWKSTGQLTLP